MSPMGPDGDNSHDGAPTLWAIIASSLPTKLRHTNLSSPFARHTGTLFDTMIKHGHSWQVAHELFLVYIEAVETSSDDTVHIRSIYANGSQDTYLKRAIDSANSEFKGVPAVVKDPGTATPGGAGAGKWNGNFNRKATTPCFSFNMGTVHPARSLDDKGTCKHNHVCDHWVSNKGPAGTCGGRHPRSKCDNPNKCDAKVAK